MIKVVKQKNKFLRYFNETLKLSAGFERFIATFFSMLLICHIVACIWHLLAEISDEKPLTWIYRFDFVDKENFDKYSYIL